MVKMNQLATDFPMKDIADSCGRWKIASFAVFGSVLTDRYMGDSDIDVLVEFQTDARYTLLDMADMTDELEQILQRPIDLLDRAALETSRNHIRRREILTAAQVLYVA